MSDEDHILNDKDVAGDFLDTEQSYAVRLEKLGWHLEGHIVPMQRLLPMHPELAEGLAANAAQQVFVKELIAHFTGQPPKELFDLTQSEIDDITGYLPQSENDKFERLVNNFFQKYNRLRTNPVLESFKKLSSHDQRKLIKIAREMEDA